MILLLNIIMIMPASQNHSNYAFRFGLRRLVTKPTAKSGFKDQFLFESFTCDVSLNGVFVLVDTDHILDRLSLELELEFYLEYKLDFMVKAVGIVRRIQGEEVPEGKRGFALEIKEITGEHRKLLAGIIDEIREE